MSRTLARKKHGRIGAAFAEVANWSSHMAGKAGTFLLAAGLIAVWAITGPIFGYSDTWQLVINTGTTIITFLMVFLIQNSQNRDSAAIQVKLDELIRVSEVHNSIIGIEHLTEEELEHLRKTCEKRARSGAKRIEAIQRKAANAAEKAAQ